MSQKVIINGRPLGIESDGEQGVYGSWRTPSIINSKPLSDVSINGFEYPPVESGCILYLPGLPGQGATIWDKSNQGNHGTITGATWVRNSKGLWVLSFDGTNDYIRVATASSLDPGTGDFSVEAWVETPSSALAAASFIFRKFDATPLGYAFAFQTDGRPSISLHDGAQLNIIDEDTIFDGKWHHIVGDFDRDANGEIFVDGISVKAGSIAARSGDLGSGTSLFIGVADASLANPYTGDMALHRMYKGQVLGSAIAREHFNQERHLFGV